MKEKGKGKRKTARRQAEKAARRAKKIGPDRDAPVQPQVDQEDVKLMPVRPNYRTVRAAQGNKKYINVLIDAKLQMDVRVRITTRKLTWETLIESLFRKWLEENPDFCPKV